MTFWASSFNKKAGSGNWPLKESETEVELLGCRQGYSVPILYSRGRSRLYFVSNLDERYKRARKIDAYPRG